MPHLATDFCLSHILKCVVSRLAEANTLATSELKGTKPSLGIVCDRKYASWSMRWPYYLRCRLSLALSSTKQPAFAVVGRVHPPPAQEKASHCGEVGIPPDSVLPSLSHIVTCLD